MLNSSKGSLTHRIDLHLARMYLTACIYPADAMCEKFSHVRWEGHAVIDVQFIQFGNEIEQARRGRCFVLANAELLIAWRCCRARQMR